MNSSLQGSDRLKSPPTPLLVPSTFPRVKVLRHRLLMRSLMTIRNLRSEIRSGRKDSLISAATMLLIVPLSFPSSANAPELIVDTFAGSAFSEQVAAQR